MWIEPNRSTYSTPWTTAIAALALALVFAPGARGQQRTLYGPDGKVIGHAVTDSAGAVTLYGPAGRATSRTATDSSNTTTIYDAASGRRTGTVTAPPARKGK